MVDEQRRGTEWKPTSTEPTPEMSGSMGTSGTMGSTGTTGSMGSAGGMSGGGMSSGSRGGGDFERIRGVWNSGNPDEIRDEMKRFVEKGVAALAGAVRGFSERAKNEDLAGQAGNAIKQTGEAASRVVSETGEQARQMSEKMKGATQKAGEGTRNVTQEAGKQARETKGTMNQETSEYNRNRESGGL